MSKMLKRLVRAFAILPFVTLTACETLMNSLEIEPKGSQVVTNSDSFCLIAQPILFDRFNDTEPTIEQVKEHNAIGKRLCHWQGNPQPPEK
jgi:hypothetical protein